MPVPARKKSNASGKRRRSHDHLTKKVMPNCPQCSAPVKPHNACLSCGFYGGKQVISVGTSTVKIVKSAAKKAPKKKA
ncbi:MAG: 50S ribosomal protein L32 [Candidatus Uhrbacteria bacterium]|nr:50S ribosomal protein L32 [Candidatus Uhrbacteria bacterium]